MKLLTVILNYKTAEMTLESAESAVKALNQFSNDWQLTIVDNDSRDGGYYVIKQAISNKRDAHWQKVNVVESGHKEVDPH
jgi:N-acetylglucosaminyl-diphospho-decaprenol L-rhamnosyltransferase